MKRFIEPPVPLPSWIAPIVWLAERFAGKALLPARLLAWHPKAALGSGLLEAMVVHRDAGLDERILKLVRLQVSVAVGCPFCIDMNSASLQGVTPQELEAIQCAGIAGSFSRREQLALDYARAMSEGRLAIDPALREALGEAFSGRELVVLAYTAAQVNYWARLIQALGVAPAGFCDVKPGR